MKTIAAIIISLIAIVGCTKQAESTVAVGLEFKVDKLFTVDGCTVYRFTDGGYNRYFTNCHGSASWNESCGKNCTRTVEIVGGDKRDAR